MRRSCTAPGCNVDGGFRARRESPLNAPARNLKIGTKRVRAGLEVEFESARSAVGRVRTAGAGLSKNSGSQWNPTLAFTGANAGQGGEGPMSSTSREGVEPAQPGDSRPYQG